MTTDDTTVAPSTLEDRWVGWKAKQAGRSASAGGAGGGGGGAVYGIGLVGAAAYFLASAETGRDYALALPKAVLWPAVVVYKLLKHLNA